MTDYYNKAAIKKRLQTQDNRMTQNPLFVVQEENTTVGIDTAFNYDGMCFQRMEDEWETVFDYDDEYEDFEENFWAFDNPDWSRDDEKWESTGYTKEWVAVAYFFTEGAADTYIENQRHNHHGKLRTYAESLYRNPEMKAVRAMLMEESETDSLEKYRLDLSSVEKEWNTLSPEAKERFRQIEKAQKWGTEVKFEVANIVSSLDDPNAPGLGWKLSDEAKADIEEMGNHGGGFLPKEILD